jgi:hypothetical protein
MMKRSIHKRRVGAIIGGLMASLLIASSAMAHECINASKKDQASGAQIVFGPNDQILYATPGLTNRLARGIVDLASGEGFHGIAGFDFDGDGTVDASTWFGVGPEGEIPLVAQLRGPACRGLTNIGVYFEQCVGA